MDLHHKLRSTPIAANRVLAILSKMFNLTEAWGYRPNHSNPCSHVQKYAERPRERMLTPEELARLGQALEDFQSSPYVVAAIRLLIFTGARLNEILSLRWDQVNFEEGQARLAVHKTSRTTGSKTLHLPTPAIEVLQGLPRVDGNPYVIVGHREGAPMVNIQKPWRRIRGMAGLDDVRIHDLRHCFASVGVSSGLSLPIVGKLLGHNQSQTTQRYAHLSPNPLKDASESVALLIHKDLTGRNKKKPSVTN